MNATLERTTLEHTTLTNSAENSNEDIAGTRDSFLLNDDGVPFLFDFSTT